MNRCLRPAASGCAELVCPKRPKKLRRFKEKRQNRAAKQKRARPVCHSRRTVLLCRAALKRLQPRRQAVGEKSASIGKISSRPASMSKISTSLDSAL